MKSNSMCWPISNSLQDECVSNTYFTVTTREKHPFQVKSNWIPPVQPSVALETYLEDVKVRLAEMTTQKPKYNYLSCKENIAVKELKHNTAINLKKANKGSTTGSST